MKRLRIGEAAQLKALAELARGDYMRDGAGSLDDIVRVERKASAAESALGIVERSAAAKPTTFDNIRRHYPAGAHMNIIEAMCAPDCFAPWFSGSSWAAWGAVLKAAHALPLSDSEAEAFHVLAGGRRPPTRRVRELWIIAGRRSGKDLIASMLAAWSAAIEEGHLGRLRPGEKASVVCLACDREQSQIVKNYTTSYFTAIDSLRALVTRETKDGLELSNGAEIIVATNSFRQARGRTVLLAIFDECAFYRDELSATPDIELYRAIVPSMATLPNAMLVGISSAYRKEGLLYDKWRTSFGKDDERVLVIQAALMQLNPTLDREEIAEKLAADPAAAKAEWLGQFRDDIGSYVSIELIEGAVDGGVAVRPPRPGIVYTGSIDVASGTGRDSFAAAISHKEGDQVIWTSRMKSRRHSIRKMPRPKSPNCSRLTAFTRARATNMRRGSQSRPSPAMGSCWSIQIAIDRP